MPSSTFWNGKYARRASLSTAYFCLEVVPRFIPEPQCDLITERQHLVKNGNVCVLRQRFTNDVKLLPCGLALRVFLHGVELPGHVCHHGIGVVSSLDTGRSEEAFRQTI